MKTNIKTPRPERVHLWKWLIVFGVGCSLLACVAGKEMTHPSPTSLPTPTPVPSPSPTPTVVPDPASDTLRILEVPAGSEWSWNIAISPDGAILASGMAEGNVLLWSVADGTILQTLAEPNSMMRVAFSPDGSLLASAGSSMENEQDNKIRLWRVADGKLLHVLEGHSEYVMGLAFSFDGNVLASVSMDDVFKLWQVKDGSLLSENILGPGGTMSMAASPDRTMLAFGRADGTTALLEMSDGTLVHILEEHEGSVWSIDFSPDGEILATGGWDNTIRVWDVTDGTLLYTLEDPVYYVMSVIFSPDGTILASAGKQSPIFSAPSVGDPGGDTVRLWNVADGTLLHTLEGHGGDIMSIAFSPDGKILASSSADDTIRLWRVPQ